MGLDSSINLGLSLLPDYSGEDRSLFNELVRIYNALRILQSATDIALGDGNVDTTQPEVDASFVFGSNSRFYAQYAETCNYGDIIHINGSGQIVKAQGLTSGSPLKAHGFCSDIAGSVGAGSVGEVKRAGLIAASGLTPGLTYALATNGQIVDFYAYDAAYKSSHPTGPTYTLYLQEVGIALSATRLFVDPSLSMRARKWVYSGAYATDPVEFGVNT
jgi:hypothetical protein